MMCHWLCQNTLTIQYINAFFHIQYPDLDAAPAVFTQFLQGTFEYHFSMIQNSKLRDHLLHFTEQMTGDQYRRSGALRHRCNETAHFLDSCRIETIGRLIQDQQPGIAK